MTDQDAYSFFVNGYIHGHISDIESIDFDKYEFVDCTNNPEYDGLADQNIMPLLDEVYDKLKTEYISKLFQNFNLHERNIWQGVDAGSKEWHNDYAEYKSFNSNILVYLDDSYGKNTIEVRNESEEFIIYPKKGDFVWLNQNPKFEHRARHIEGIRRLISFEMYINDLWT